MSASDGDLDLGASEEVEPSPVDQGPKLSPYAQSFLGQIQDENEKAILQRHISAWDSGFTKQMQKHAAAAQQYRQFGSADDVAKYANVYRMLESDPVGTIKQLIDAGIVNPTDLGIAPPQEDPTEFKLPDPINQKLSKIDQIEQALNYLTRSQQQQENVRRQQEEDRALDTAVAELKKQYGEFDEPAVFAIAHANGGDLETAVQQWNAYVQQAVNKRSTAPAPKIMSGSTLPPLDRKPSELTAQERKSRIAQALSQMNG